MEFSKHQLNKLVRTLAKSLYIFHLDLALLQSISCKHWQRFAGLLRNMLVVAFSFTLDRLTQVQHRVEDLRHQEVCVGVIWLQCRVVVKGIRKRPASEKGRDREKRETSSDVAMKSPMKPYLCSGGHLVVQPSMFFKLSFAYNAAKAV